MRKHYLKDDETTEAAPKKKGKRPWKPAGQLGFLKTPPGYTPRWCDSEPMRLAAKIAEGWEFVNETNYPQAMRLTKENGQPVAEKDTVTDGTPLTGSVRYREMVGMMLANDQVEARKEYYDAQTRDNTAARVRRTEDKQRLGDLASAITKPRLTNEGNRVVID